MLSDLVELILSFGELGSSLNPSCFFDVVTLGMESSLHAALVLLFFRKLKERPEESLVLLVNIPLSLTFEPDFNRAEKKLVPDFVLCELVVLRESPRALVDD